jgi:hypothetical protein
MANLLHENGDHRVFPAAPSPAGLPPGPTSASTPASSCNAPPRRVYLAGPMRGYPRWNVAAFDSAADQWRALGCEVVNPCDLCPGLDPRTVPPERLDAAANDPSWLREVILADCQQVCQVDAVVVLPGWERSYGATVEVSLALFLGLPVYGAVTMRLVVPKPLPWSLLTHTDDAAAGDLGFHAVASAPGFHAVASAPGFHGRDWGEVWRNLPDRVGQGRGGSNA